MSTVQELGLPLEQQVLLYLLFRFLGYPQHPGLSREENVSLCIYSAPDDYLSHQYDSPLKNIFSRRSWNMKEYKSWTILSQSQSILDEIPNPDSLVRVTQRPADSDIEAGYLFKQSCKHIANFNQKIKQDALDYNTLSSNNMSIAIGLLSSTLERCHGNADGLDLKEYSIDVNIAIKANPNTPEIKLFSQTRHPSYALTIM